MRYEISVKDLLKKGNNVNIIDLRSNQSFNNNHIPGSINIPYEKLLIEPKKYLEYGTEYYVYCQHGKTSSNVSFILRNQGFNVINIIGGYEQWVMDV